MSQDKNILELLEKGYVLECPGCGGLSAYAWQDINEDLGIAHIGAASCWEWQCGHCKQHWMEKDSPLNSECFTHELPEVETEWWEDGDY